MKPRAHLLVLSSFSSARSRSISHRKPRWLAAGPESFILNLVAVVGIGLGSGIVPAANALEDRDRSDWSDPPLVLTPSRLPQRLDEAPNAMTVIDRAMIEASGARRLEEVLRLVPGFQVGHKYNNQPTVAYHGLSDEFARRVLVLVNGQRIFQYSGGGVDWNNLPIPLQDIERIEVIRGPSAAAYDVLPASLLDYNKFTVEPNPLQPVA